MGIREELLSLASANGGTVRAETALQWASGNPQSALYTAIDARGLWDDEEAAEYGRLAAMRDIIQRVRVKIVGKDEKELTVRAFVSITEDRNPDGGYRHVEAVLRDRAMTSSLLAAALNELEAMRRRYEHLVELAEVFAAVDRIKRKKK